jgi:hypothetical protein
MIPRKGKPSPLIFLTILSIQGCMTLTFLTWLIAEIEDTNDDEEREKLLDIVQRYPIEILEISEASEREAESLADQYVKANIVPEKKIADAYHIALSVLGNINYLVSWNFRHLANVNKEQKVHIVNLEYNYRHDLRIITPLELMNDES